MFKKLNLKRSDFALFAAIFLFAVLTNLYQEPYISALIVVLVIITVRVLETIGDKPKPSTEKDATPERRTVQQIINDKLEQGAIEKAVDERFDKVVDSVISDLFGNYGDITREIKTKLKETMNPHIEKYDFGQHAVKIEHLLNQLVHSVTTNQDRVIRNVGELIGTAPIESATVTELFNQFSRHVADEIDQSNLTIDEESSEPRYQNITVEMTSEEESIGDTDYLHLTFTCEEDDSLTTIVKLRRWNDSLLGKDWNITSIKRKDEMDAVTYTFRGKDKDITQMQLPMNNLRNLTDLEIYLLKLHYDNTSIIVDETEIYDEDVEVNAEPDVYMS